MDSDPIWHPTRRSDAFDLMLAAVLALGAAVSLVIAADEAVYGESARYDRLVAAVCVAGVVLPIAVRRRFPSQALVVASIAYIPLILAEVPEYAVAPNAYFILFYTTGAYGGPRRNRARALGVVVIFALVAWGLHETAEDYPGEVSLTLVNFMTTSANVFYLAAAWMLGDLVRTRRAREATLEAQADELRAVQAERAARAVRDERVRIARELHDVVAHHVSVMGVQAGAARHVMRARPEAVPELLATIESSSRQAVAELQQMLGLLREDDTPGTDPQPTLAGLDQLVDQMRDAGLEVRADLDGTVGTLPPGVDLSAFRIVQEALTNTLKHAGPGTTATVGVVRRHQAIEIVVTDDGRGERTGNGQHAGPGHGLVGMRERVSLLGGELKAGKRPGGGFEVRAWLPLREGAAP